MSRQRALPGTEQPTSTAMTATLLREIPRRFPARAWRRNVGMGYGVDYVKSAIGMLRRGDIKGALDILTQRRPISFGHPGEADIACIIAPSGCMVGIEIKAGRDKMSAEQVAFQNILVEFGGIYLLCRDVETTLKELGEEIERRKR